MSYKANVTENDARLATCILNTAHVLNYPPPDRACCTLKFDDNFEKIFKSWLLAVYLRSVLTNMTISRP